MFQFTPAHDGRQAPTRRIQPLGGFNSRPRTTGDDPVLFASGTNTFQFTPAHDGRQGDAAGEAGIAVSIHARARRATLQRGRLICD